MTLTPTHLQDAYQLGLGGLPTQNPWLRTETPEELVLHIAWSMGASERMKRC